MIEFVCKGSVHAPTGPFCGKMPVFAIKDKEEDHVRNYA